ncbi:hypothetical protein [Hydrogenophaga sp.]|jgi:hypothetical protein|uniref:hypothetical protein n=1 Tax=Hydrogenophaga sp. TaxID=1904254 RepID=UPI002733D1B6|nr:hypothetical protein [Hydrogenophaga sp.]MDP1959006.1 hypothetical protein [Methylotenera sp.]MDP3885436.1 hypothetical protein [Hydrogenophaga sp.]HQS44722.1 hypothetical protein [Methylotenera sp.]
MNKNNTKILLVGLLLTNVVGCASVSSVARNVESNVHKKGEIYGLALQTTDKERVEICSALKFKDPRCDNPKQVLFAVMSRFGYSSAGGGGFAFSEGNLGIKPNVCSSGFSTQKDCSYIKATVEPGKLGTVLSVVSRPGEKVCKWSGMPRAGGTECESLGWNYSDHEDVIVDF